MRAHPHKGNVQLQRRITQHAQDIQLGIFLFGHEIQNADLQRTNVLMRCPVLVNNKEIFFLQLFLDRKIILNPNRHNDRSFLSVFTALPGTRLLKSQECRAAVPW